MNQSRRFSIISLIINIVAMVNMAKHTALYCENYSNTFTDLAHNMHSLMELALIHFSLM